MPKMIFKTRVKYKDAIHNALEPFDVDEGDAEELEKDGGVPVNECGEPKAGCGKAEGDQGEKAKPKGKKKA